MDQNFLLIAISIAIAILARPIEMLWDRASINDYSPIVMVVRVLFLIINYLFPLFAMFYIGYNLTWDKESSIAFTLFGVGMVFIHSQTQLWDLKRRIKILERDKIAREKMQEMEVVHD